MENTALHLAACLQGYIPVRKDPFERSEMITQVLFGEYMDILDDEGKWLYIKMRYDGYEGWIDKKCASITEDISEAKYLVTGNNTRIRNMTLNQDVIIPIGSVLPALNKNSFKMGPYSYQLSRQEDITEIGKGELESLLPMVLSVPYLWGGRSGFGFDCSGLVQFLCRAAGKKVPRDAGDQSAHGSTLSFIDETRAGDLAFFDNTEGLIHHVGMITGSNQIVHASGMVRIDRLDHQGIYNAREEKYSHKLRVLKRI